MQMFSFKKTLASSALALLAMSSAFAIPRGPCEATPKDVCCEEPKPGPFAFTYPKDMNLACPSDFYFRADFLAYMPTEDGLDYAVADTNGVADGLTGGIVQGFSTGQNSWSWDFGFRLGAGFYLDHDAWNLDLQYMWFKINEEVSSTIGGSGVFIPQWLAGLDSNPVAGNAHASARWHLSMNVFDAVLGKPYHVSRYLVLNPFFGFRGAIIDQNFTARYGGSWAGSTAGAKMLSSNDFWGVGTRMGANSEWNVGGGFQLVANVAACMLYGNFDVGQSCALSDDTYAFSHDFYRNSANMEIQVGFAWGMHFNDMKHYLKFQAMWEFQQWWDQNWLRRVYSGNVFSVDTFLNETVARGDLSLSGISGRVQFDF